MQALATTPKGKLVTLAALTRMWGGVLRFDASTDAAGSVRAGVWDRGHTFGEGPDGLKVKDGDEVEFSLVSFRAFVDNWLARGGRLPLSLDHASALGGHVPAPAAAFYDAFAVVYGDRVVHFKALANSSAQPPDVAELKARVMNFATEEDPDPSPDGLWGWRCEVTPLGKHPTEGLANYAGVSPFFTMTGTDEQGREIGPVMFDWSAVNASFQAGCELTMGRVTRGVSFAATSGALHHAELMATDFAGLARKAEAAEARQDWQEALRFYGEIVDARDGGATPNDHQQRAGAKIRELARKAYAMTAPAQGVTSMAYQITDFPDGSKVEGNSGLIGIVVGRTPRAWDFPDSGGLQVKAEKGSDPTFVPGVVYALPVSEVKRKIMSSTPGAEATTMALADKNGSTLEVGDRVRLVGPIPSPGTGRDAGFNYGDGTGIVTSTNPHIGHVTVEWSGGKPVGLDARGVQKMSSTPGAATTMALDPVGGHYAEIAYREARKRGVRTDDAVQVAVDDLKSKGIAATYADVYKSLGGSAGLRLPGIDFSTGAARAKGASMDPSMMARFGITAESPAAEKLAKFKAACMDATPEEIKAMAADLDQHDEPEAKAMATKMRKMAVEDANGEPDGDEGKALGELDEIAGKPEAPGKMGFSRLPAIVAALRTRDAKTIDAQTFGRLQTEHAALRAQVDEINAKAAGIAAESFVATAISEGRTLDEKRTVIMGAFTAAEKSKPGSGPAAVEPLLFGKGTFTLGRRMTAGGNPIGKPAGAVTTFAADSPEAIEQAIADKAREHVEAEAKQGRKVTMSIATDHILKSDDVLRAQYRALR